MKVKTANGEIILRKISDADYEIAKSLSPRRLKECPTCGGREEYIVPGIKQWVSNTYRLNGEEVECNCQLQIALEIRYLLAGIGYEYMPLDWNTFDGDGRASKLVLKYVKDWKAFQREGMGVMFSSPTQGVGKTWGAVHIGKELIKQGQKVKFIDFPSMVDQLCTASTQEESKETLMKITFLILDDIRLGISERQNDLYANMFESVVRHRTMFNLPTITTTNLTDSQFELHFPRIHSLLKPKQRWVSMDGTDYRLTQEAEEAKLVRVDQQEVSPIV